MILNYLFHGNYDNNKKLFNLNITQKNLDKTIKNYYYYVIIVCYNE